MHFKQATRLPNHSITPFISPVSVLYKTMIVYQKQIANWWKKNRSMKSIFYNGKPVFTISTLHENLLYQETKWITWIRTNAMPLNGHLSKMKFRNDNQCSCRMNLNNTLKFSKRKAEIQISHTTAAPFPEELVMGIKQK